MTRRDEEIIRLLCFAVRFFSLEQVARGWWSDQPREIRRARQRMQTLATNGWVRALTVLARPLLTMHSPVYEWSAGTAPLHAAAVSRRLRGRWTESARDVEIFLASPRAAAILGSGAPGIVKNLCQTTHDLHVAEVYLIYRERWPELVARWLGEDAHLDVNEHEKRPDAVLLDGAENIVRVVEFGGAYRADRVQAVHDFCSTRNLPYQLW